DFLKQVPASDRSVDGKLIEALWELDAREYQYVAIDLLVKCAQYGAEDAIELYEKLVLSKSWWDTVDLLARVVGIHFIKYPHLIQPKVSAYLDSGEMWLQRIALLFQLHYKTQTNWPLLEHCILSCIESREFFIQKAIGWALRQYSKVNPDQVAFFIEKHPLAPLSRREGMKYIAQTGF
ncbi:MAG: DNA alkylation repair protein, partial [Bacteroidota bacterium]